MLPRTPLLADSRKAIFTDNLAYAGIVVSGCSVERAFQRLQECQRKCDCQSLLPEGCFGDNIAELTHAVLSVKRIAALSRNGLDVAGPRLLDRTHTRQLSLTHDQRNKA